MPVAAMLSAAASDDTGEYTCIDYLVASTEWECGAERVATASM